MGRIKHLLNRTFCSIKANGILTTVRRIKAWLIKRLVGSNYYKNKIYFDDAVLHLAFYPSGGLGDYIISKVILEEVLRITKCEVTIFADKLEFAKSIYGDVSEDFRLWYEYDIDAHKYDLALWVEHFVHVDSYKKSRVRDFSVELASKIEYILQHWDELYVDIEKQCWRERIQFERCRTLGLDRWTELRMNQAFKVERKNVCIPLDATYEDKWKKRFYGTKYITINYGADAMVANRSQLKLWTVENYEAFIKLMKDNYPNIEVVQLGTHDAKKLEGVDNYVLGKSLELTKFILKNSLCHIDCEGGLVHLATQLGTKCIVLFGPTPVHMYGYEQNINIVSPFCNNCMGLHELWAYDCYRKYDGNKCMESIIPEEVFREIKKVIKNENF
ncbi:hypothetical protein SAMN02910377_00346 [Pseudobutyrivibrio ruminis]|uniref:ADP-heptose:LPS heptosyltransferase n=1 Tax=Pseudobutyrivibrio ruminis TaxID=46206 RepID=A0A1H7F6T2_9FIRM|nr:hypothetical protein [Pseudobutyrivibrio ruminis]SEK21766.1 hypothetical protein SAMN02910377_00346 [Pseudobutyrivibrio ruminis]